MFYPDSFHGNDVIFAGGMRPQMPPLLPTARNGLDVPGRDLNIILTGHRCRSVKSVHHFATACILIMYVKEIMHGCHHRYIHIYLYLWLSPGSDKARQKICMPMQDLESFLNTRTAAKSGRQWIMFSTQCQPARPIAKDRLGVAFCSSYGVKYRNISQLSYRWWTTLLPAIGADLCSVGLLLVPDHEGQ